MNTVTALLCLVVGVTDGDTLKARCGQPEDYQQIRVRIAAIDAPEHNQPYGQRAKQALSELCYRQQAVISPSDKDRYGRLVAEVRCQGQDAATHMVSIGMAWVYDRHAAQHQYLYRLQHLAKTARRGLWADANPLSPWEWRRGSRNPFKG